jgi:hypothetical protein
MVAIVRDVDAEPDRETEVAIVARRELRQHVAWAPSDRRAIGDRRPTNTSRRGRGPGPRHTSSRVDRQTRPLLRVEVFERQQVGEVVETVDVAPPIAVVGDTSTSPSNRPPPRYWR